MNRHLPGVMAVLIASAILIAPAFADHRPGNVVVMGGTLSLTGNEAGPGGRYHNSFKLYVGELNARGGLLGHKVKLKYYDDKSNRRTAIELYEKLFTEDKVDLVLGPYGSHLTDAVANVMERYRQPFVAHSSAPEIYQRGRKYTFSDPVVLSTDREEGTLNVAKKIGVNRIAIITQTGVSGPTRFLGAQKWAKRLGLNVVLQERYRKDQTDFTALLRKIEASGAEALFAFGRFNATVTLLRQLRELDINVKMFSGSSPVALQQFIEELGSTAEYVVGFSQWEPKPHLLGHPGMKEFIEIYEKRYGVKPAYHAAGGYATMQIYEAAVKEAGSFDSEKVRDALASITVDTVVGGWKANEQGVGAIVGVTFQIQNGERVIVWPEDKAEAKALPMPKWEDRAKK